MVEKADKHYLSQVIEVTPTVISHVDGMYPWYSVMKMTFSLCGLPLKSPSPQSNHEETLRQIPVKGHSTKYMTSTHQKQGTSKKLSVKESLRRQDD